MREPSCFQKADPGCQKQVTQCGYSWSEMHNKLDKNGAFGYFRMGLVTGIVEKRELIEWADREIDRNPAPDDEIIELALCGSRPYSEIIWLLSSFVSEPDYGFSLPLLLARAGISFERDPWRARDIIMGLRLLSEEEKLPEGVRTQLATLRNQLERVDQSKSSLDELGECLSRFLEAYAGYRPLLFRTVYPQDET